MRFNGIEITYNEETYSAQLVNYTVDTEPPSEITGAPGRTNNQPRSYNNLLLLIVLVCVLVPLAIVAVILIIGIIVVKVCFDRLVFSPTWWATKTCHFIFDYWYFLIDLYSF